MTRTRPELNRTARASRRKTSVEPAETQPLEPLEASGVLELGAAEAPRLGLAPGVEGDVGAGEADPGFGVADA